MKCAAYTNPKHEYISKLLSIYADQLKYALIIFSEDGTALYANGAAVDLYRKLGHTGSIMGMDFSSLALDGTQFCDLVQKHHPSASEVDGGGLRLHIEYGMLSDNMLAAGVSMLIRDVTEDKEKELKEKSIALREIHHRVKNNLQTTASILRLQSKRINNEQCKILLTESAGRILSIAAAYEILARNGADDVDIKTIISKVVDSNIQYAIPPNKYIKIEVKGDSFSIASDKATSIALIVNEVMQNAVQYAFIGRNEGNIDISIEKGKLYSSISIIDDGVGFDMEKLRPGSLGFTIVRNIIKDKLYGNLNIETGIKGTKIEFNFKNE